MMCVTRSPEKVKFLKILKSGAKQMENWCNNNFMVNIANSLLSGCVLSCIQTKELSKLDVLRALSMSLQTIISTI